MTTDHLDEIKTPERRKRGRPALLSKEAVLKAAIDLSSADPLTPVTVTLVARHLNVTSMAIYKYFASRDELLQALSAHLLDALHFETVPGEEPLDKIERWLRVMRQHFLVHPQLVNLISWEGGQISLAWQNQNAPLYEALMALELEDDDFAQLAIWIFRIGMSVTVAEVWSRLAPPIPPASIELVHPIVLEGWGKIGRFHMHPDHHDRVFEYEIEQLMTGLRNVIVRASKAKRR